MTWQQRGNWLFSDGGFFEQQQHQGLWRERKRELYFIVQQLIDELGLSGHLLLQPTLVEMSAASTEGTRLQ